MKSKPIDHIKDLVHDPKNARKHTSRNVGTIVSALHEVGAARSIVIDEDGVVLAGNATMDAAAEAGITAVKVVEASGHELVAVRRTGLTPEQKTRLALYDNRAAELAEWDAAVLEQLARDNQLDGLFNADELHELLGDLAPAQALGDPDAVPEPSADPITKPGDLWLLGDHRLLCGDSTKAEDVARLMAGTKADLCFTSPPYALGKSVALSGNKAMAAKANPYGDHEDNADEWDRLMRGWFAASLAAVSDAWVVNVQPLAGNKRDLVRFVADNANRLVDIATWDKGHAAPQMAAGVMASRFEWMIIFAANDGASRSVPLSSWRGTVQSVYAAPPQRGNEFSEVHAATMPLHVPAWVMQTLCDQSRSVYEPFCGTGTTLIAAEQLGRKCYGMEISPQYCDVIVKRWETYTGKTATREAASA